MASPPPASAPQPPTDSAPAVASPPSDAVLEPSIPHHFHTPRTKDKLTKPPMFSTRDKVAEEIYQTEAAYVQGLKDLRDVYIEPSRKILPVKVHTSLFSNIHSILDLNDRFLKELEKRIATWGPESKIGDLFLEFAPFFKMYTQYVNNHERVGPILSQMKKSSKFEAFQKFEEEQRAKEPRTRGMKMASFLSTPISRIPRYKLLLKELQKHTEKTHPDFDLVASALEKIETVAIHINESVRASENRKVILDIQSKFDGVTFIAAHRLFVVAGTLLKRVTYTESRPFKFFLFSDVLVWAKHRKKGGKYRLANSVPIDDKFDVELVDTEQFPNTLRIMYDQQSFLVSSHNGKDIKPWFQAFRKCVHDRDRTLLAQGQQLKRPQPLFVLAPVFHAKDGATFCKVCHNKFGLLRKRYNCKACGEVVCSDCSTGRLMVNALKKKVRVCSVCMDKINSDQLARAKVEAMGTSETGHEPKTLRASSSVSSLTDSSNSDLSFADSDQSSLENSFAERTDRDRAESSPLGSTHEELDSFRRPSSVADSGGGDHSELHDGADDDDDVDFASIDFSSEIRDILEADEVPDTERKDRGPPSADYPGLFVSTSPHSSASPLAFAPHSSLSPSSSSSALSGRPSVSPPHTLRRKDSLMASLSAHAFPTPPDSPPADLDT